MGVHKISVSLDESAYQAAKEAAQAQAISLSAWLSHAATYQARIENGIRAADEAIAEIEAKHGPIPEEVWRRADEILDRFGVGLPERRQ